MNRTTLKQLAEQRIKEAKLLLDNGFWPGAYYLAGYALECALKVCILKYVDDTGAIFRNKKFLDGCWTHDLEILLKTADLEKPFGIARGADPDLDGNWVVVDAWSEESRYELKTEKEAKELYEAITNAVHGIMQWVQGYW